MKVAFPPKLRRGDTVRVVAPARSRSMLEHDYSATIDTRFADMGLKLTYGRHVDERDDFDSSSITSRVEDLHEAFADPAVAAIITVIGGFNSNELLPHLDWDLIAANPKVLCGYSDITALQNAILSSLDGALLALEDDYASNPVTFARDPTSLLQLPDASGICGLAIGRFQRQSHMTRSLLEQIVANKPPLARLPVLANIDFGHTYPLATLPIGETIALTVADNSNLTITEH
jgi:muramoyltetrapeptide carboxypeptidase LdcA involved in peptidoglycan recycling